MEFSKKVEQTLAKTLVAIRKKADQMTDIAALKYSRYQLEKERGRLLHELGSYVYKAHLINPSPNDKVTKFIDELKALDNEIRKVNLKIKHRY